MSHNKKTSHAEASERSYIAAAHRENRSEEGRQESLEKAKEIHKERTGKSLHADLEKNSGPAQPGLADTEEGRKERAFIAAAHREGRDEDKKAESLQKASELHEQRTGEPLAEAEETAHSDKHRKDTEQDKDTEHLLNQERAYVAAAHRKGRDKEGKEESLAKASEIHQELTGKPLPEAVEKGIIDKDGDRMYADDKDIEHLQRQERSLVGAAHRKGRDEESRNESLAKASEIHEELTGEPLPEAVKKGIVDEEGNMNENGKREHKDDQGRDSKRQKTDAHGKHIDQPGLAGSADGRHERAFIAAAHRDGRSEEGKQESLEKASELHEKRTGEPLAEAIQGAKAAQ